ncbi:MAG: heparan-alpha-glucosaminide N-acetyltransferase domain-containing protein [Panacibacter sp.]
MDVLTVPAKTKKRIESIDLLRGLIMIIMALDHIRDYFHTGASVFDPTDLSKTNVILFFTRWITHFCAPLFMLLSGTSAYLVGIKKGKRYLSKFLFTRGLWLIFLEFTVVSFAWYFDVHFTAIDFLVIWALGISMLFLAAVIYLPFPWIIAISLIMIFGHNLLDNVHVSGDGPAAFAWALLHYQQIFQYGSHTYFIGYPVIPWIAVMALGYCLGKLYTEEFDAAKRKKILLQLGTASIVLFIMLRFANVYGDPSLWSEQSSPVFTFLSFLNVSKYPPSLLYLLFTIGPALLFLAFSENAGSWLSTQLKMIGRVAMFYYLVHLYIIHLLAMAATYLCGFKWSDMILTTWINFEPKLNGYGFSLGVVYLVWFLITIILYFLCRWYDKYKRNHRQYWWLSYL